MRASSTNKKLGDDFYVEDSILARKRREGSLGLQLLEAGQWPVVAPGSGSSLAEHLLTVNLKTDDFIYLSKE